MRLTRPFPLFDPFAALGRLHADLDRALGAADLPGSAHIPPLDLSETDNGYEVRMLLAGADPATLDVQVEGNILRLSGERVGIPENAVRRYVAERPTGRFERVLELPARIDAEGVDAGYVDGVLTVTLPKAREARPRSIAVTWQ